MNFPKKMTISALVALPLLVGCVNPGEDDANAATKQGAVGGALLGLTMGALLGEPDLAVKGAIAGGVAGGVAGASHDIQNNRENIRHDSRNDALGSMGSDSKEQSHNATWEQLEYFVGKWNVGIQNHIVTTEHEKIDASGTLSSLSSAEVVISNDLGLQLNASFSYATNGSQSLNIENKSNGTMASFVGEAYEGGNRVSFYPASIEEVIYADIPSQDVRLELSFIGRQVWLLDSYAFIDGKEQKIQTFRFTKYS